jgi:hypothetical protein
MSSTSQPSTNAESEKLAFKFHASTHLSARYLEEMCRRAWKLSPQLVHYLTFVAHSCLSCLRTARPKPSMNISLSNVNREFNNSVQVDIFYLTVSTGVISYMLWIPAQVFLWLHYAKTGTLSCFTDHQLKCRVTRSLRKGTSRTCCVPTI